MVSDDSIVGPMNLGNPVETTIVELAQEILRLTGSKSAIKRLPLPVDDPMRRCPDISKASQNLGWRPEVSLEQGLVRTIDYFDKILSKGSQ
jgi:UDP-glucuronate decarboxylase